MNLTGSNPQRYSLETLTFTLCTDLTQLSLPNINNAGCLIADNLSGYLKYVCGWLSAVHIHMHLGETSYLSLHWTALTICLAQFNIAFQSQVHHIRELECLYQQKYIYEVHEQNTRLCHIPLPYYVIT